MGYQGWAEGGSYEIVDRMQCEVDSSGLTTVSNFVDCSITVEDDLVRALDLDFKATDTFSLAFFEGEIIRVELSSDDPETVQMAFERLFANPPELFDGVCAGFFDGGPKAGECVQAFVQGFEDFAASEDFRLRPDSPT